MAKKQKKFADDGWAVWIDGDDTSTVYINDWLNPKGKSYVDIAVRIRNVKAGKSFNVYVPFDICCEEIEDMSLRFNDTKILQATFNVACIVDYMKNPHTSEVAYNAKTVDIVHISTLDYQLKTLSKGTLLSVNLEKLHPFLDNNEAYFIWRMPHKSLDEIFRPYVDMQNAIGRFINLITTPVVSENYGYSIRINESRLLPEEITRIGSFHRQKLRKALITLTIVNGYELNDTGCYRIRRLEENLYENYLPKGYIYEDAINYQWHQTRDHNFLGQFNFYFTINRNFVSKSSMIIYMVLLLGINVLGEILTDVLYTVAGLFS